MADVRIDIDWKDKMSFDANIQGHTIALDADSSVGGEDRGPRPKALLLVGLAGCTGMDVISILKKMRVVPDDLNIAVEADSTTEHPKHYNSMKIIYTFTGKDLPKDKLEKAVSLSQDRYCGVSFMLGKTAEIKHEIIIKEA